MNPVWNRILVIYTRDGKPHPQWQHPIGIDKDGEPQSKKLIDIVSMVRKRIDTGYAIYGRHPDTGFYYLYNAVHLSVHPSCELPPPKLIIDTSGDPFIESYPLTEEGLLMASDHAFPVSESLLPKCNPKYEPTHPPQEPEPGRVRLRSL